VLIKVRRRSWSIPFLPCLSTPDNEQVLIRIEAIWRQGSWLAGWLAGWLAVWLAGWLAGPMDGWRAG